MIHGVHTKSLKFIPDERGSLMEILRRDDELFLRFGQVYLTTAYPGVVKAWHLHQKQIDNFCCVKGVLKVALFDGRKDSPTYKEVNEFFLGERNPLLLQIPNQVYHGFKCIGESEALLLNVSTEPYNHAEPDETRLPWNTKKIPYDWHIKMG